MNPPSTDTSGHANTALNCRHLDDAIATAAATWCRVRYMAGSRSKCSYSPSRPQRTSSQDSTQSSISEPMMIEPTLYRDCWTAYHPDGTDYLNDELEQKVLDAISPYVAMSSRSLAPIAAVRAVVDWIEKHGPVERCEHRRLDEHGTGYELDWCPGAGIGGDNDAI